MYQVFTPNHAIVYETKSYDRLQDYLTNLDIDLSGYYVTNTDDPEFYEDI